MNKLPTLEQRIAAALTSPDITSTDLAALIQAVEVAAQAADEDATKAREQALDPTRAVDVAKVGAEVIAAELTRDRLRAALPALRTRYTQARHQEAVAKWKAEAAPLRAQRDALVQEFAALLPIELIKQIAAHLVAMQEFDYKISSFNYRRPDDDSARSIPNALPAFAHELKISNPDKPAQILWPPPPPYAAMAAAIRTDPFVIADADKYIDLRHKRMLEDNRRQIAEAERSQREFEKKKAAETEAAKERDRQAYRERGWPSR